MLNAYTTGCSLLVCSVLSKNSIDIGQLRTDMVTLKSSRWLCLFHPVFSFIASSTFCSCYAKMNSEQAFIKIRERLMHGNVQALGLTWEGHHLPGAFRAAWHWPIDLQMHILTGVFSVDACKDHTDHRYAPSYVSSYRRDFLCHRLLATNARGIILPLSHPKLPAPHLIFPSKAWNLYGSSLTPKEVL